MLKGQIVRKMLSTGEPIGPYCIITGFKGSKCSLVRLESFDGVVDTYVKRDRVKVFKSAKLILGHKIYERIQKGLQVSIIHDASPKWVKIYKDEPEIIQLRDELYSDRTMVFPVEEVRKMFYHREIPVIRLDLGVRII